MSNKSINPNRKIDDTNNSPQKNKNNSKINTSKNENEDEIEIEVIDRGINTDKLNESELNKLINQNKELSNNQKIYNVEHDTKIEISQKKQSLIEELMRNDEIYNILFKTNSELTSKMEMSNKKYDEIIQKIESKKGEDIEQKLNLKIKELEKGIKAYNSETERYKKLIDELKNKIEFEEGIDRTSNLQKAIKQESLKNKELKQKLDTLIKFNKFQSKNMENLDKKYKIQEKMEKIKNEIKQNKNYIKDYSNKFIKLDKFTKIVHEKIVGLKMYVKKALEEPKVEVIQKAFTNEETKDTIGVISILKNQISDRRKELIDLQKSCDVKAHELLVHNRQIEKEYNDYEKMLKNYIYKKNELIRKLTNIKNKKKKINQKIKIDDKEMNKKNELNSENNDNNQSKEEIGKEHENSIREEKKE